MPDHKTASADEKLRQEFNQWAEQGSGEEMERHHISITEQTLALMNLQPGRTRARFGLRRGLGEPPAGQNGQWRANVRDRSSASMFRTK